MKVTIQLELPDTCNVCGTRLSPMGKKQRGEWTEISVICQTKGCSEREHKFSIRRVFTHEHLAQIREMMDNAKRMESWENEFLGK